MQNRLTASALHVFRGDRHVLRGLSFEVQAGEYLEVVGPNGVGKTSLLRTVVGLVHAESGSVDWNGQSIHADAQAFHAELGYLGHDSPLKADLTATENLWFGVGVRRSVERREIGAALADVGATAFSDRPIRTLSAGQRRRVALAGLLLASVPLWVLDEPATNLDAEGLALVGHLVARQISAGGLVVAAVHQPLPLERSRVRQLSLTSA